MGENKNYNADPNRDDLKKADAEKSSSVPQTKFQMEPVGAGLSGFSDSSSLRKSKKMPVAVDIIIAILMLAMVAGVITGAYFLFRYYSNDYEGIQIEYTLIKVADTESLVRYRSMKNQDVYIDDENNTHYLGKVISASVVGVDEENGQSMLVLVVRSNAKYRRGEGYTVGDHRIAVGADYTLRADHMSVDCTIVEMEGYGMEESTEATAEASATSEQETIESTAGAEDPTDPNGEINTEATEQGGGN